MLVSFDTENFTIETFHEKCMQTKTIVLSLALASLFLIEPALRNEQINKWHTTFLKSRVAIRNMGSQF